MGRFSETLYHHFSDENSDIDNPKRTDEEKPLFSATVHIQTHPSTINTFISNWPSTKFTRYLDKEGQPCQVTEANSSTTALYDEQNLVANIECSATNPEQITVELIAHSKEDIKENLQKLEAQLQLIAEDDETDSVPSAAWLAKMKAFSSPRKNQKPIFPILYRSPKKQ